MKTKFSCPNCGAPVLKVRWDAGYHYCKSARCFEALGRRDHIPLHETPPNPDEIDLDPYELDEIASQYQE